MTAPKKLKVSPEVEARLREIDFSQMNQRNLTPRWTRFCWWLSRKLGGRRVFGKADLT